MGVKLFKWSAVIITCAAQKESTALTQGRFLGMNTKNVILYSSLKLPNNLRRVGTGVQKAVLRAAQVIYIVTPIALARVLTYRYAFR